MRIRKVYRYTDGDTLETLHRFSRRRAERDTAGGESDVQEVFTVLPDGSSDVIACAVDCYSPEDAARVYSALAHTAQCVAALKGLLLNAPAPKGVRKDYHYRAHLEAARKAIEAVTGVRP